MQTAELGGLVILFPKPRCSGDAEMTQRERCREWAWWRLRWCVVRWVSGGREVQRCGGCSGRHATEAPRASSKHSRDSLLQPAAPGMLEPSAALPSTADPTTKRQSALCEVHRGALEAHWVCRMAGLHRALPRIHAWLMFHGQPQRSGQRAGHLTTAVLHHRKRSGRAGPSGPLQRWMDVWLPFVLCCMSQVSAGCRDSVRFRVFWMLFCFVICDSALLSMQPKPAEASWPPSQTPGAGLGDFPGRARRARLSGCSLLVVRCRMPLPPLNSNIPEP